MTSLTELFSLDTLINDEERDIRDTAREFANRHLRPNIAEWYETGTIPARDLAREFGKLGMLGMHLQGYGCAGSTATAYGLVCHEIEAADAGLRSLMSVQGSLAMYAIYAYGSEEQKQQWLPEMATGEKIGCFGLTEADFGSNPGGMRTRAKRDGDDWVLSGSKMWITNGTIADIAVVWARTDDGIRGFLVPQGTKGFESREMKHKLSMRASVTAELFFDDVRLPYDAVLPESRGLKAPLGCLTEARFGIIFGVMGAARDCLETAISYSQSREVFDKPLSGYQLTQAKLADCALEYGKGMLLALHLGRRKDSVGISSAQVSVGKLNNVREALQIARTCRTILGANGITLEYPVMRHAANLETVLTYEGTSEIHQLAVGQALTGENAFR